MKITCACEYSFDAPHKQTIDLDKEPEKVLSIQDGNFQSFICPQCGKNIRTEIKTRIEWNSKKEILLFVPEKNRIACMNFCAGFKQIDLETNKEISEPFVQTDETPVIGYYELLDRINVLYSNLNPQVIEACKFFVLNSAKNFEREKIKMIFQKLSHDDFLEFFLYGIRSEEVGLVKVPVQMYDEMHADMGKSLENSVFKAVYLGQYLSYKNVPFEEDN